MDDAAQGGHRTSANSGKWWLCDTGATTTSNQKKTMLQRICAQQLASSHLAHAAHFCRLRLRHCVCCVLAAVSKDGWVPCRRLWG
jgi:hypothetical protein